MIPILYSSLIGAPITSGMGMGPLVDCIECTCYEEINGEFECTFRYPCTGSLYDYIKKGAIVAAKPSPAYGNNYQKFIIYKISKPINGIITVNAHHKSYELTGFPILPFSLENVTPNIAMKALEADFLVSGNEFTFLSDLTKEISISSDVPKTMREVLLGENSIATITGNEFEFDNEIVKLVEARGQEKEIEIIYGRELLDYQQEESIENAYSHILGYATATDVNGNDIMIFNDPAVIQLIDPVLLGHKKCLIRDFTGDFEDSSLISQTTLSHKVSDFVSANNLSAPAISFRVSFLPLKKIPEYRDLYSALSEVGLGDNITVFLQKLKINRKARIVATTYNVLSEKYISVDVGERRKNVADTIYLLEKSNTSTKSTITTMQNKSNAINDYIVEQGKSGIWTYRKWASGVAECWGQYTVKTAVVNEWGSLFSANIADIPLPFEFKEIPMIWTEATPDGIGNFVAITAQGDPAATASRTGGVRLYRGVRTEAEQQFILNYQVKGRWK